MIVQGQKVQTIDVEVDPISFINDMMDSWKVMCRVPKDAEMTVRDDGVAHWKEYRRMGHISDWEIVRSAYPDEIVKWKAFQEVLEVAHDFE